MSEQVEASGNVRTERPRPWRRFVVIALALHLPLFAYPVLRLCHWLALGAWLTAVLFLPLFFSQIVARVYLRDPKTRLAFWLRRAADIWLGISPVLLCLTLLGELPVLFDWFSPDSTAQTILTAAGLLTIYSIANAYVPSVVTVQLSSAKLKRPLSFVQITDVHIGSRSSAFLDRVIDRVSRLEPEFLCITGDFIDARNVSEEQLGALKTLSIPVYFSIGNHERYGDLEDIVRRLRNLGVTVLRNQAHHEDEIQFIGIDDMDDARQVERQLAKLEVDQSKFVLLLYHRPRGLEAAAAAGIDLMISGHTHNGQIVPFNFVVGHVFEMARGLFREGESHIYVSPGTGTWGPVMRLGTRGEITLFKINPR